MSDPQSPSVNKLSCEQCRELLSDYVDRELADNEKAGVELHLKECIKCGSESTRMHGLKNIVQHWDGVKGSGEFRKSVIQKMIRESQQMPSGQFTESAAESARLAANAEAVQATEDRLPPIWILLVAAVMAIVAYFVVLKLRGM